jgi:serine/threonine protein kinase
LNSDHAHEGVGFYTGLNQDVAIKVMLPGASTQRFMREARVLAKIRSPNIVVVHDFELLSADMPVLIMEWVEGKNLFQVDWTLLGNARPVVNIMIEVGHSESRWGVWLFPRKTPMVGLLQDHSSRWR